MWGLTVFFYCLKEKVIQLYRTLEIESFAIKTWIAIETFDYLIRIYLFPLSSYVTHKLDNNSIHTETHMWGKVEQSQTVEEKEYYQLYHLLIQILPDRSQCHSHRAFQFRILREPLGRLWLVDIWLMLIVIHASHRASLMIFCCCCCCLGLWQNKRFQHKFTYFFWFFFPSLFSLAPLFHDKCKETCTQSITISFVWTEWEKSTNVTHHDTKRDRENEIKNRLMPKKKKKKKYFCFPFFYYYLNQ